MLHDVSATVEDQHSDLPAFRSSGLPDDVMAEIDAHFGYDQPMSDADLDELADWYASRADSATPIEPE